MTDVKRSHAMYLIDMYAKLYKIAFPLKYKSFSEIKSTHNLSCTSNDSSAVPIFNTMHAYYVFLLW